MKAKTRQESAPREQPAQRTPLSLELMRRSLGLLLMLVTLLPWYTLLATVPGTAPRAFSEAGGRLLRASWLATALVALVGVILAVALPAPRVERQVERLRALVERPRAWVFSVAAAVAATVYACSIIGLLLEGRTFVVDTLVQSVHARYVATGALGGPRLTLPEFWSVQYMLNTSSGWVSQYPPGHIVVLGLGHAVGAPWIMTPLFFGLAVFFTGLAAERLPGPQAGLRLGLVLLALSPFVVLLTAMAMSHVTAAAAAAAALYSAARARTAGAVWAAASGACVGILFLVRPYSALLIGPAVTLGPWLTAPALDRRRLFRYVAAVIAGAAPAGIIVALYNAHFFGHPFLFGYTAAAGPMHGLGFHIDPFGTLYTPSAALAYTSVELAALGFDLVGSVLPAIALIGVWLIVATRVPAVAYPFFAWAGLLVVGNFFYWHHDLLLGPRMLGESAPAWALLLGLAASGLYARLPARAGALSPRAGFAGVLGLVFFMGLIILGPRWIAERAGPTAPAPPPAPPWSIVFVHENWPSRLGARLHARGLQLQQIYRVLGSTPPCEVERMLAEDAGSWGPDACRVQRRADIAGSLDLLPYLPRGDLPGLQSGEPMYVRDLGPAENERLLSAYPDRQPAGVLLPAARSGEVELVPYDEAMRQLWGARAGGDSASVTPGGRW